MYEWVEFFRKPALVNSKYFKLKIGKEMILLISTKKKTLEPQSKKSESGLHNILFVLV